jgi:hypothetical protein
MRRQIRWRVRKPRDKWLVYQWDTVGRRIMDSPRHFESWHAAMLYVSVRVGYPCPYCKHNGHTGQCGFPVTEEIRVGRGTFDPVGTYYRTMLVGVCHCGDDRG